MAEVALVQFVRVARAVPKPSILRYLSPFSKHAFAQAALLAIPCLLRYADWTYREAEVRLREPVQTHPHTS